MTNRNVVVSAVCLLLLQLARVRCASIQPRTYALEETVNSTEGSQEKTSLGANVSEQIFNTSADELGLLITDSPPLADETQQPAQNISVQEESDNTGLELGSSAEPDSPPAESYLDGTGALEAALNASQSQDQTNPEVEDSVEPDSPPVENPSEIVLSGDNSESHLDGNGALEAALNASQSQDQTNPEVEDSEPITVSSPDQSDSQLITDSPPLVDETQQPAQTISVQDGYDNTGLELGSSVEPDSPPAGNPSESYLDGTGALEAALNASEVEDQTNPEVEDSEPIPVSSPDQSDSQLITVLPPLADETVQPAQNISVHDEYDNTGLELGSYVEPDSPPAESYLDGTGTLETALNASQSQEQTNPEVEDSEPIFVSSSDQSDSQLITDLPPLADETQQPAQNVSVQEGSDNTGLELGSSIEPDSPPTESYLDGTGALEAALNASEVEDQTNPEVENSEPNTVSSPVQSDSQLITVLPPLADETQQPAQNVSVQEEYDNTGLEFGSSVEPDSPPAENPSEIVLSGDNSETHLDGTGTLEGALNASQSQDQNNPQVEDSEPIPVSSPDQADSQLITDSPPLVDETQQPAQNVSVQEGYDDLGLKLGSSVDPDSAPTENPSESYLDGAGALEAALNASEVEDQTNPEVEDSEPIPVSPLDQSDSQLITDSPPLADETQQPAQNVSVQDGYDNTGLELGSSVEPDSPPAENPSEIVLSGDNSESSLNGTGFMDQVYDGDAPIAGDPDYPGSPVAAEDLMNKLNRGGSSKINLNKIQFLSNINPEVENSKPLAPSSADNSQEYNGDAPIAGNPDNPGNPVAADDLISQLNRGGSAKKGTNESQPLEKPNPEAEDTAVKSSSELGDNGDAPIAGNPDNPGSPLAADDLVNLLNRGGSSKKDLIQSQFPEAEEAELKATSSIDQSQPESTIQREDNSDAPIIRNPDNLGGTMAADDLMSDLMANGR